MSVGRVSETLRDDGIASATLEPGPRNSIADVPA